MKTELNILKVERLFYKQNYPIITKERRQFVNKRKLFTDFS